MPPLVPLPAPSQITVFTGRFGSGKTEIALNYALHLVDRGLSPYLVDLDIVTPYFRTRDKAEEMRPRGVEVVSPFAVGRHIAVPAISPHILGAIEQAARPVIIDLGGDQQGARALAQYASTVNDLEHVMHLVVNPFRPFMDSVEGIQAAVREIEGSSGLCVSALVSNPNLMSESSSELFLRGHRLIEQASLAMGLDIAFVVVSDSFSKWAGDQDIGSPRLIIHRFFPMFDLA